MTPSARLRAIPDPAGDAWAVFERAVALKAEGRDVTMLSIGDHDTTTPHPILDAMIASARGGHTGYAAMSGTPGLRAAIAERASLRTGAPLTPEAVLVLPGGQFALFAALMAVTDPGDAVVLLDPYYATYPLTVRSAGAVPRIAPTRPDAGFLPDLDTLDAAMSGARALILNSPNNPTGAVYPRAVMERIAGMAIRHDCTIISDEVYDGQVWEGTHLSPRTLPGMAERCIVIGSLSKSHVMTGARLGWLVAPEGTALALRDLAISTTYGVPGFIQDAAEFALRDGDAIEAEAAARYRRRRDLAVEVLAGSPVRVSPPQGGMYLMLDIRPTGLSGIDFAMRLLEETGVATMPGEGFGKAAAGHLRVALTVADERLADALRRLVTFAGTCAD
ncbi:pyridoxal phosphate-dependent aminotransferase [Roseobacter sp. HKCCA0434]|uniref:pyridoxal phosphate-dependent aminotransferase n=1 Tax=Roseobacter sp. HKCCA0434 TaxID=3079297 RepID=UPI0029058527|nr:pyridoxal phosphate-dependent aminotransferase [Roseobacter sp. HKCCA0434]